MKNQKGVCKIQMPCTQAEKDEWNRSFDDIAPTAEEIEAYEELMQQMRIAEDEANRRWLESIAGYSEEDIDFGYH